jgi:hypothetical protein
MGRGKKIDEDIIVEMIKFYNEGNTARKTAIKFNVGKTTVLSYNKPIEQKKFEEKEKGRKNVIAVKKRRDKLKELAIEYKNGKCEKCGYNKCSKALEFHHVDPTKKEFGIGNKGYTRSWEKIKQELDKCIMVCANCHREIHNELSKIS